MKVKNFEVKVYYSTLCRHIVKARNEIEAFEKAKKLKIKENEIMANLEPWDDADTVEDVENYENHRK